MSWYNNTNESSFQDATQIQLGGSGSSTTTTIIQNGDNVGIGGTSGNTGTDTTIDDLISLRFDNPYYNTYITNNNPNGVIYFRTSDNINEVKIENGRIWGYYNYDPIISAITFSKWIDIVDDIVRARQAGDNALAVALTAGAAAGAAQLTADAAATAAATAGAAASGAAATANAANASASALVDTFDAFKWTRQTTSETFEAIGQASFNTLRQSIKARAGIAQQALVTAALAQSRASIGGASLSSFRLFSSIVGVYAGAGLTAGVVAGVAYLFDYLRTENERNTLEQYLRILEENQANGTSLGTTQDVLHLSGLQIVSSTNQGFTTAGVYDVVISNDAELEITISQTLTATITKVIGGGENFSVGQTISIPKSLLGGGTGNLDITIISLITEKTFIENEILNLGNVILQNDNRMRRRRNIPNTSSFSSSGFNITNTAITEPNLGEITNEPTISLKLDNTQFAYDGSGNLQLTNYNNLIYTYVNGSVGINTSSPSPLVKLDCKGSAEFGDGVSVNQGINLRSLNGLYVLGTDDSGNNSTNNNQFYIYDANDIAYRLTIQNSTGNVGIDTATPGHKLDVNGNVNIASGSKYKINGSDFAYSDLAGTPPASSQWTTNGNNIYYSSGTVGINIATPNTSYKLDVNGSIYVNGDVNMNGSYFRNGNAQVAIGGIDTNLMTLTGGILSIKPHVQSKWTTNGSDIYYNTGSVGINNSTPSSSYKLDVNGSVNTTGSYYINGNALTAITGIDSTIFSLTSGTLSIHPTQQQKWTSANATDIYWNVSGGRVGIGMVPTYQLDVSGNCRINGTQNITGNLGIGVQSPNQKLEVAGAVYLTGSPSNPGNNSSASFWNQAGVGPTISGFSFAINTNGTTEAMRINDSGNVGIGMVPNRRLDISDGTTITNSSASNTNTILRCVGGLGPGSYNGGKAGLEVCHTNGSAGIQIGYSGIGQSGNGTSYGVNIYGRGAQLCNMYNNNGVSRFEMNDNGNLYITGSVNPSDIRIKENIRDIDDNEALNKILALQPKKYEYIDKQDRGHKTVIGFIAQQVREVIPEAIQISEELAPNILEWCDYIDGKLYINNPEITIGTKINFRTNEDKTTGDTLRVKEVYENYIIFDDEEGMRELPSEDITKLFVHGYHLKDFHMVEKAMIFTTNVCATQELYKIIMEQKEEINLLKEILSRNGIV